MIDPGKISFTTRGATAVLGLLRREIQDLWLDAKRAAYGLQVDPEQVGSRAEALVQRLDNLKLMLPRDPSSDEQSIYFLKNQIGAARSELQALLAWLHLQA